ncbi:Signal recognition particle subunit SRP68 [Cyphellophora attinorum]|uniref:Signal recognition particle subunit SRP68 n=1 Tax=Cyphellophora attinorum TaxID=1664694 RepID=A0A0N0NHP6_9EURO|nr:Signal recognition particle subunit SRP68 [Phialophora attinorum]KPI34808.1 Signal recognition particle subunit SRP68 [Phialophora attinorum]
MAMKSAQSPENTQKPMPSSTKRQIASRLRRAIAYAENLAAVLEASTAKASKMDTVEARAYLYMLRGSLDFEKSKWQTCLKNYSLPRVAYTTLGKETKNDAFKDLLSGIVDPSIRYAAYQLKLPRTKPVDEIVIENFPSNEQTTKSSLTEVDSHAFQTAKEAVKAEPGQHDIPTSITWRSRKVKLEDAVIAQSLGAAMSEEETLQEKFTKSKSDNTSPTDLAASYDRTIEARQDAADATKAAIDDLAAEGVDPGDARVQSLQVTRTAVNYAVIEFRIGRNRVLCGPSDGLFFEPEQRTIPNKQSSTEAPIQKQKSESTGRQVSRLRERTALYDAILQSIESVKDLPGVIADTAFVTELDAKHSYFRALKCLAIGRSHALNNEKANALALFSRARQLCQSAATDLPSNSQQSSSPNSAPKLDISTSLLSTATSHLTTLVTRYRALTELSNLTSTSTNKTPTKPLAYTRPLSDTLHLNIYHDNPDLNNIVNYPPKLQPIPVKPLFFDLAWTYIDYPKHGKKAVQAASGGGKGAAAANKEAEKRPGTPEVQEQKKKGWFGFGGR